MIISRLTGGLGNQMFQYAAGVALAEARRTRLALDLSWFAEATAPKPHERYALGSFQLSTQVATCEEINRIRGADRPLAERGLVAVARKLGWDGYARRHAPGGRVYFERDFRFHPDFFRQPDDTYLHGNWQSEKFFAPVAARLRADFRPRDLLRPAIEALAEAIGRQPSAFMHVRRGDYVRDPRYARDIGALDVKYYQRAIASLRTRHPDVMLQIFSDEIDAVTREFALTGPHTFVREPPETEAADVLQLMSLCDHAIIANSTLGWWGAWLGEKPGQIVIAPQHWFADGSPYNAADIVPERWERC